MKNNTLISFIALQRNRIYLNIPKDFISEVKEKADCILKEYSKILHIKPECMLKESPENRDPLTGEMNCSYYLRFYKIFGNSEGEMRYFTIRLSEHDKTNDNKRGKQYYNFDTRNDEDVSKAIEEALILLKKRLEKMRKDRDDMPRRVNIEISSLFNDLENLV